MTDPQGRVRPRTSALLFVLPLLASYPLLAGASTNDFEGDEPNECSDGADNDRDGQFDCDDSDCKGSPHCTRVRKDLDEHRTRTLQRMRAILRRVAAYDATHDAWPKLPRCPGEPPMLAATELTVGCDGSVWYALRGKQYSIQGPHTWITETVHFCQYEMVVLDDPKRPTGRPMVQAICDQDQDGQKATYEWHYGAVNPRFTTPKTVY
jgi:hypothetical protein